MIFHQCNLENFCNLEKLQSRYIKLGRTFLPLQWKHCDVRGSTTELQSAVVCWLYDRL